MFMRSFALSALGAFLFVGPVWAQTDIPAPIALDAESSTLDRQSNTMTFKKLRIRQGALSLEADEASASDLDFDRSEWTFRGHVRMQMELATISADRARFLFEGHVLSVAELSGAPATLEAYDQVRQSQITGGAEKLDYSRADGSLRLSGTAWLREGQNEMRGCDLIYDVQGQRVTAGSSECGEPIRITILPPARTDRADPSGP
jgi:lipopolysaccharide transport protein LptA